MACIADSSAIFNSTSTFPQHQALLTLIKDRIENPNKNIFQWLDLACGRGQILANLSQEFSENCCKKIEYFGIDIVEKYCRQIEKIAQSQMLNAKTEVCDIVQFDRILKSAQKFDAVTMTNSLHEITPKNLAATFVSGIARLKPDGFFFLYDMESLAEPELGAIPWQGKDIERIFHDLLIEAGTSNYLPSVSLWKHSSCTGWHIQICRNHLCITDEVFKKNRDNLVEKATNSIRKLLILRLLDLEQILSSIARCGAEGQEKKEIKKKLYDFFAIYSALKMNYELPLEALL